MATTKQKALLISAGMLVMASAQILAHYHLVSDLAKGSLTGIGIGLILSIFIAKKIKPALIPVKKR